MCVHRAGERCFCTSTSYIYVRALGLPQPSNQHTNPASTRTLQAQKHYTQKPAHKETHVSRRTWSGHTMAVRPSVMAAFSCSDLLTLTLPMRGVAAASQILTTCGTREAGGACTQHSTPQHGSATGREQHQANEQQQRQQQQCVSSAYQQHTPSN